MTDRQNHSFTAAEAAAGARLDKLIADHGLDLSRMRVKSLILDGHVRADGATITDPSYQVKPGLTLEIEVPEAVEAEPEGQDIPLTVVFEDAHLIVIDKPAGLVVHPAAGNPDRTLVNALIHHCGDTLSGIGGTRRPGIVHRLDKDTSGLLIAAKTDAAHNGLAAQFAAHSIERAYRAVVWGRPAPAAGTIEGAIGRSPRNRKKMAVVGRGGKHAVTHYKTLKRLGDQAALVECRLETGRTHQIRVHMTHIGHPIVGDPLYGRGRGAGKLSAPARQAVENLGRQALHAGVLGFKHPISGDIHRFESELPSDITALISQLDI